MAKIKTTTRCLSHSCNRCGRKLHEGMFTSEKLFLFGIMMGFWVLMMLGMRASEKRMAEPDCYRREYVGERQELEQYKIFEIDCEEIGK